MFLNGSRGRFEGRSECERVCKQTEVDKTGKGTTEIELWLEPGYRPSEKEQVSNFGGCSFGFEPGQVTEAVMPGILSPRDLLSLNARCTKKLTVKRRLRQARDAWNIRVSKRR